MQLKLFDIFSSVIPGALVLCCVFFTSIANQLQPELIEQKISIYKDVSAILTAVFIVASYLTGYIIHAIGSWIEPILWKTWGGRPSQIILSNNSPRLGLGNETNSILNWLKSQSSDSRLTSLENMDLKPEDFRHLFQVAKNLALKKGSANFIKRMEEFNNSYVFSRNILVAFLITFFCASYLAWNKIMVISFPVLLLFSVIIVWWRARDRAIYYSREIMAAGYYS